MKRLKATLEENGERREIPPFELDVLMLLDPKKKYDFHFYDTKGRVMGDPHLNASALEVASYLPGIREIMLFNEKHRKSHLKDSYSVEIKEAA